MKLTIITICYNDSGLVKTCESIVKQTRQDFEWVVIDGGSRDEIQKLWNKYKHRINTFISEKDSGIYDACNKGIRNATGEYIIFLNAGDYFVNNKVLEKVYKQELDRDIVYGNIQNVGKIFKHTARNVDVIKDDFWIYSSLPTPATFIKKELFEKYGYFDEKYKIVSDWALFMMFIKKYNCSYKHIDVLVTAFNEMGISSTRHDILQKERLEVLNQYYTQDEITHCEEDHYSEYSLIEKIFSVKNAKNRKHKIITILNIHFKLARKDKF